MMRSKTMILLFAFLAAGCGQNAENAPSENGSASVNATAQPAEIADAQETAPSSDFDINSIPVSNARLGDFPYISLPEGYIWQKQETRDFDHFLFWTGAGLKDVEGQLFMGRVGTEKSKKPSAYELRRNLDAVIAQAGGVLVTDSQIPREVRETLSDDMTSDKYLGLGDIYNDKTTTWVVRRADREIWIHATPTASRLAMAIVETKPFVATATLLPASDLKDAIDKAGKAVVQINFATDASDILPESRPQVDAIASMLKSNPALKLSIEGHTDDTGNAQHNLSLSRDRAGSVKRALVATGIAGDRLVTNGFGANVPIASNSSEEGKAKNRRVELVRL